jgi:hypothetical protein
MAQSLVKQSAGSPKAPRGFAVSETEDGRWLVRERHGAVARLFPTQKAAIHFALFELGNCTATALLTPPENGHGH